MNRQQVSVTAMIQNHLDSAERLERHANHWWRASKYAWLHAASIHRLAARELAELLPQPSSAR